MLQFITAIILHLINFAIQIEFLGKRKEILLENFSQNGEWDIVSTSAKWLDYYLDTVDIPFSIVRFNLNLKRKVRNCAHRAKLHIELILSASYETVLQFHFATINVFYVNMTVERTTRQSLIFLQQKFGYHDIPTNTSHRVTNYVVKQTFMWTR